MDRIAQARTPFALLLAFVVGCTTEVNVEARTQILLRVNTQSEALREGFSAVRVMITRREGDAWQPGSTATFARKEIKWPIDLPVTPGHKSDRAKQFQAVVEALDGKVVLAQARVVTTFVPGNRKVLDVWIEPCSGQEPGFVCDDADCQGSECKACSSSGECEEVGVLDALALPDQSSELEPVSGFDAGSQDVANRRDARADTARGPESGAERDAAKAVPDAAAPGPVEGSCDAEGQLRCAKPGTALRQRCEAGKWVESEACESGLICDLQAEKPGACRELLAVCSGSAGKSVCDGEVMRLCDAQGNSERMEACSSANHCQRGLAAGKCAICLAGEYRCTGAKLEVCADDGQSFKVRETCDSAALCNAAAGTCGEGCMAGSKVCAGDVLRKCKEDLTAFEDEKSCEPGLCDATGKQCDVCVPMAKSCMGNSVTTCNAQGQAVTTQACAAPKSICTGNGVCVECTSTTPCAAPADACMSAACDLANGVCTVSPKRVGTTCPTGVCDGLGECVECTTAQHCSAGEVCQGNKCIVEARCGDGIQNGGEPCDDGNTSNNDACLNGCVRPSCGDGYVRRIGGQTEECDPKATSDGFNAWNCSAGCRKQTTYLPCAGQGDCPAGVCFLGVCSANCPSVGSATSCPASPAPTRPLCVLGNGTGTPGYCFATACRTSADCAPGSGCNFSDDGTGTVFGYCTGCMTNADCPAGRSCVNNSGTFGICA